MTPAELLRWQWDGYPRYHRARANLMLHAVVVPLFLLGNVTLLLALAGGFWLVALAGAATMAVSVALQGSGHRKEPVPPEPFTSPANAIARLVLEQWITFPRFVLSGGWMDAWRRSES
jgi:hypothetical protein